MLHAHRKLEGNLLVTKFFASAPGACASQRGFQLYLVPNVLILSEIIATRILIIITKMVGGLLNECCRSIVARKFILPHLEK